MKKIFLTFFFVLALSSCQKSDSNQSVSSGQNSNSTSAMKSNEQTWYEKDEDGITIFPADLPSNKIVMAGSSTVYPVAEIITEGFKNDGFAGEITLDSIGTGGGFKRFCGEGSTDIALASREINQHEEDDCKALNREYLHLDIGTDMLTVVVNPKNDFLSNTSKTDLAKIFVSEYWDEVNSSYPHRLIKKYIPGTDSGTFDYFVEIVFDKNKEPILNSPNVQKSEDDEILVRGIKDDIDAIGFFGYGYYIENKDGVKILSVDNIIPSENTIENYPISRPLFLYVDKDGLDKKTQLLGFLSYFLSNVSQAVKKSGYFPTPQQENIKTINEMVSKH